MHSLLFVASAVGVLKDWAVVFLLPLAGVLLPNQLRGRWLLEALFHLSSSLELLLLYQNVFVYEFEAVKMKL